MVSRSECGSSPSETTSPNSPFRSLRPCRPTMRTLPPGRRATPSPITSAASEPCERAFGRCSPSGPPGGPLPVAAAHSATSSASVLQPFASSSVIRSNCASEIVPDRSSCSKKASKLTAVPGVRPCASQREMASEATRTSWTKAAGVTPTCRPAASRALMPLATNSFATTRSTTKAAECCCRYWVGARPTSGERSPPRLGSGRGSLLETTRPSTAPPASQSAPEKKSGRSRHAPRVSSSPGSGPSR
mmetsp:Transcript_50309/g.161494  ORF Transcript_50309/g.161494 Transcript_50309/m.161494 type:complete len:246 (-) Transcript_50309:471-1208(-)